MDNRPTIDQYIRDRYREVVNAKHPDKEQIWPLISGSNVYGGNYGNYVICVFTHTGTNAMTITNNLNVNPSMLGYSSIDENNIRTVKVNIRENMRLSPMDSVIIIRNDMSNFHSEMQELLYYHEIVMGVVKMKIFLSHKGADKPMVREYKSTLSAMGFDVWLDEDAMPAGTELHRALLQGFKDSCAAIFFVTPNYIDRGYLASEINYAISEKMAKGARFSIITLLFEKDGLTGQVPELLKPYIWKQPNSDLNAVQEVLKSLPIQLGRPMFRV